MNISFPNFTPSSGKVESQKSAQARSQSPTQAAGDSGDLKGAAGAELSLSGTSVQALKAHLATLPDLRMEMVQSLQIAVENGTYKPSSQQIAEAIHSDLFGAPSNTGPQ